MDSPSDFALTYQKMTDDELAQLASEGDLIPEARQALQVELSRRKIDSHVIEAIQEERKKEEAQASASKAIRTTSFRGTGICFYGRNYLSEGDKTGNIQTRTKWFAFGSFPIFPIASYRITYQTRSRFKLWWGAQGTLVEKIPLQWTQILTTWSKALGFVLVLWLVLNLHWRHYL